jgi:uncharacterized cupin superfamily protein
VGDPNVHRSGWDFGRADPPFGSRAMRLGPRTGAQELGTTLYEIDPGGAISPYHVHHGNEELLLVSWSRSCGRCAGPPSTTAAAE